MSSTQQLSYDDQLRSPREVAQWASVSEKTIRRRIAEGVLPPVRVGPLVRIRESDLPRLARMGGRDE
jgi:excisionase family DNA binding protein